MATSAPPAASPRSARRALLPLLGVALGIAGLAWGGMLVWQAQPAVAVSPQAAKVTAPEPVEESAFRVLRGRLRDPAAATFKEVRVFDFGTPHERAVCGRVLAARETPTGGVDFVVRVILPGGGRTGGAPLPVIEEGPNLPRATANARGRYCRDANDPRSAPRLSAGSVTAVSATTAPAADVQAGGNAFGVAALGGGMPVVLRRAAVGGGSAVNLRNGPGGGAAVIGVLPRGQVLDVFERAPGGWLRVGVGEPWGWAHSSLLIEAP